MKYWEVVGYAVAEAAEIICAYCAKTMANNDEDIDLDDGEQFWPVFAGSEDAVGGYCARCHEALIEEWDEEVDGE